MSGPRARYVQSTLDMSTSHASLLGILSNLIQRLTSTLGTTYSKDRTCIEGYKSRSQE
jgi:hypothetical protein